MRNSLMSISDKILLRKRALIETVNDELKNIAQIEHTQDTVLLTISLPISCWLSSHTVFLRRSPPLM